MSNFGKIKNIWNLDVVSREEMKTILQEWDDTLSTFQNDLNEVKRLTKLEHQTHGKVIINTGDYYINDRIDYSRPVYIRFKKLNNNNVVINSYSYVVMFNGEANAWFFLNENVSVRFTSISAANNKIGIEFRIQNLSNNEKISRDDYYYTPKTLTTTINETQEEGEAWEISK